MSDDTYNGWKNRETWCAALWLSNDEGLYCIALDAVESATPDGDSVGYVLQGVVEELFDMGLALAMRDDVGSLWRVDWDAVAASFVDDSVGGESCSGVHDSVDDIVRCDDCGALLDRLG